MLLWFLCGVTHLVPGGESKDSSLVNLLRNFFKCSHRRTRNTDGSVSLWETPLSCEERPIEEGRLELQQLKQYHGVRSRYRETDVEEEEGR